MKSKPRILFVSHAATRNGATILLLNTLRWLRANSDLEVEILVHGTGDLLDEFKAIGPTTVWRNPAFFLEALPRSVKSRWKPKVEAFWLKLLTVGKSYDLVYFNTSAVAANVLVLAEKTKQMLWHIHELEYALRLTMGDELIRELFPQMSRFVVVSESVRDTLEERFGVPAAKMDLVNGSVSVKELGEQERQALGRKMREKLGCSENDFVVGGCGAAGWRKGTDLFLQIAKLMGADKNGSGVKFLWIGGSAKGEEALRFAHDVERLGLRECCRSLPTTGDVMDYYHAMDVFALTSREDPFPLVMLEAGGCHVPTVCFAESGGGPEYVGNDAGLVAPYLDLPVFAAHLEKLKSSPELRKQMGEAAARKVKAGHVIASQAPKILASIQRCLSAGGGRR